MRIIFCASSEFAIPTLNALLKSPHQITAILTKPDKPAGRGYHLKETPIKHYANKLKLQDIVWDYYDRGVLKTMVDMGLGDILVSIGFGGILSVDELERIKYKGINVHPSLLPAYRGPAPMHWALIDGQEYTGVTIHLIERRIDSGRILLQERVKIEREDDFSTLQMRLAEVTAPLLLKCLDMLKDNSTTDWFIAQDESKATYAPAIKKRDCKIDWHKTAHSLFNFIRAFSPKPGAFTYLNQKILKIFKVDIVNKIYNAPVGTVVHVGAEDFTVKVQDYALRVLQLQLEGSRRMSTADFLHGHRLTEGTVLT